MCDDEINPWNPKDPAVSRRSFGIGVAAAVGLTAAEARAQGQVVEKDVVVKTADGESEAVLFHPSGRGTWPGVLVWPDIGGLRPVFREMGRRLAAQGHVVLVVNPFYRSAKAAETQALNFGQPEGRQKLGSFRAALVAGEGPFNDAKAYIAFIDAQPQTNKRKRVGVQGYCMGGPLSFQTAGAVPGRIGAVASFHGGGLTTKEPSSPHLLVAKTKASYLVAVAKNDDARDPESKEILKQTFAETKRPATVEVYQGDHGWCVRGSQVYNEAEAERAWAALSAMYKKAL
ncbi:dienelactone hydrolase family protein [Phenylobacterium deserti]|uniref:Dienelactone hydrolase family protein n=1 Tax=Phenylobacterium deserti TaxID=1914756 RepID=A0A328ABM2_9CAUL|nr:dienelactone hydrolase family protein [Phenylobacterium deserti]RAK52203.1 dienelactone hydrolase family protein [Phenylobacterium deserti]